MPPKGSGAAPKPLPGAPLSPAAAQQKANSVGIAEYELPKTSVMKLAKGSIPDNVKMQQDVVLALLRGSTVFINHLTAVAYDVATARSAKKITARDVMNAIIELDFGPADALIPLMEQELNAFKDSVAATKASKARPSVGGGVGKGKGRKSNAGTDVDMTGEGEGGDDGEDGGELNPEGAEEDEPEEIEDEGEAEGEEHEETER
ncbi:DNA polymerase epsilon subunit 3, partial [Tremellales sp. Uapishka_1]